MDGEAIARVNRQLLDSLLCRASVIQATINELRRVPFATWPTGVLVFLDFLKRITESTRRWLLNFRGQHELPVAEWARNAERELKRRGILLSTLHDQLAHVVNSRREQVPEAMIPAVEGLIKRWAPDHEVIVESRWKLNYLYDPISDALNTLLELIEAPHRLSHKVAAISFPAADRDNVLAHSILAHEIGHLVNVARRSSNLIRPAETTAEWRDLIKSGVNRDHLMKIAAYWLAEIAADAFAICLIGPAYLFAFAEFGLADYALDQADERHPPARMRLLAMLSMLCRMGYRKAIQPEGQEHIQQWKDYLDATPKQPLRDRRYVAVEASLRTDQEIATLLEKVQAEGEGKSYDAEKLGASGIVRALYDRIVLLVPPNEARPDASGRTTIADVPSMLNAAWIAYSHDRTRIATTLSADADDADKTVRDTLNRLLLQAMEMVAIQSVWRPGA